MEFGYFTLSDNHYENNARTPNQFVADITEEALHADRLGMHSAWIGEHHFNSLGVLSCPDLVLAYIAARTKHIRLAPAVTVLPLHHPIRVAEQWATLDLLSNGQRRFRDRPRLRPARIPAVPRLVRGQSGHLRRRPRGRAQAMGRGGPHLPSRQALLLRRRAHHAQAGAEADPDLCRIVLQAVDRAGGAARLRPDRRALRRRHELRRPEAGCRPLPRVLRQIRHQARPPDVQLLHPLRRQPGAGGRPARAPDPLLPRMRDPGAARRSEDRAAELSLFRRHGGAAATRSDRRTSRRIRC